MPASCEWAPVHQSVIPRFDRHSRWYSARARERTVGDAMMSSQRSRLTARANVLLGLGNLLVGAGWVTLALLGTIRDSWMGLVVGVLFLAIGVISCIGSVRRHRAARRQAGREPDQG